MLNVLKHFKSFLNEVIYKKIYDHTFIWAAICKLWYEVGWSVLLATLVLQDSI